MKTLNEKQLKKIKGGVSPWAIIGTIAAIIFGIGTVDGYVRPLKCH